MDYRMKVLHLVRKSSQLEASFMYNQISNHIEYKPYIIFRKASKGKDNGFAKNILSRFSYIDLSEDESWYEKMLFKTVKTLSKRQILKIERFITDNQIQICHFHYGTDCGVFYPLQKRLEISSVVSFYGYDIFSFPKRFCSYGKKYLTNRVFSKINCILAMSPEMQNDLIKIGCPTEKIKVHYHGVPSNIFYKIKRTYKQENNEFTLLNISYFDPVKGHIFIFNALRHLIDQGFSNIRLRIVGSGFYLSKLKEFIEKNKLIEYVSFLGSLKYGSAEMKDEYKNADAFIHPSVLTKEDKEGIPGAIVEAMFAGLPVISTYHGGIPYIIKNEETGLLVTEWDIPGLSNAIRKLMIDHKLREQIGKSGQEYAFKHLNIENKELELEEIYDRLIYESRSMIYN
jgi:colanic acid/amylovoran biosynthesis glycosyltransferase